MGLTSPNYIGRHKRLDAFDRQDHEILQSLLGNSAYVVVTPNVLSEASNLLRHIAEPARSQIMRQFAQIIPKTAEHYVPSADAARSPSFLRLGLADAANLIAASAKDTLLTADFDLWGEAERLGRKVVNFNHVRDTLRQRPR